MNRLRQFWHYAQKVFDLPRRLAQVRNRRSQATIPTRAVTVTVFLGGLLRIRSRLGLEIKSRKKGWQRLVGHAQPISDDALGYVLERYDLEDLRVVLTEECWNQRQQVAGEYQHEKKTSPWRWLVDASLDGYSTSTIWKIGHSRWGVENHAFNELTQH